MYDLQLYLRTLSEFARVLRTPNEAHIAVDELADRVTEVLGLAGSGVSLARDGRLEFDAGHGSAITEVERTQERVQAGPCVTAFETGEVVAVTDLTTCTDLWPDYCATAARVGISAVAAIPLLPGDGAPSLGALNLYAEGPAEWPEEDLAAAGVMADMATGFLINASHHHQKVELAEQLQRALRSRVIVEQAKGVMAARHQIPLAEAFERIRRYARNRGVALTTVAEEIARLELDL